MRTTFGVLPAQRRSRSSRTSAPHVQRLSSNESTASRVWRRFRARSRVGRGQILHRQSSHSSAVARKGSGMKTRPGRLTASGRRNSSWPPFSGVIITSSTRPRAHRRAIPVSVLSVEMPSAVTAAISTAAVYETVCATTGRVQVRVRHRSATVAMCIPIALQLSIASQSAL